MGLITTLLSWLFVLTLGAVCVGMFFVPVLGQILAFGFVSMALGQLLGRS